MGLNLDTGYELAELKLQWLVCDFGRRLRRYRQAEIAVDIAQLQPDRAFQTVANEVAVAYSRCCGPGPSAGRPRKPCAGQGRTSTWPASCAGTG